MASIQKRTDAKNTISYRVEIRLKGFPPQRATFKRLTDAKKWVSSTESAIRERRYFKTAEALKHSFADMVDRYIRDVLPTKPLKAAKLQTAQMKWWRKELGHHTLADISPALISECRDKLLKGKTKSGKTRSPATVNRYLAALSHSFSLAMKEWGWLEDSPMRKVNKSQEPRGRTRFLSDDERTRLLASCKESPNPFLYPIVVLALSTGMRRGEIMGLKWSDVDFQKGRITLHQTKNNEIRVVALTGLAKELLEAHSKVRPIDTSLLFPSEKNRNTPQDIRSPWLAALESASIESFLFHDLRHSAASYLAMNGASLAEIAEVLGHKTLQMVKRYAHLSEGHTAKVVADMNNKIFG